MDQRAGPRQAVTHSQRSRGTGRERGTGSVPAMPGQQVDDLGCADRIIHPHQRLPQLTQVAGHLNRFERGAADGAADELVFVKQDVLPKRQSGNRGRVEPRTVSPQTA